MFKRRNGNGSEAAAMVAQLEAELATSQAKRAKLREQLAAAEAALNEVVAARRKALLEADGDDVGDSHDIVVKGTDRDALLDAIEQFDGRIQHLESRIAQERSKAEHEAAAAELAGHARKAC
jgi:hypothetical protein